MTDFFHSFLFQDSIIEQDGEAVCVSMVMDSSKEGWVSIPHGGIGMGGRGQVFP